MSELTVYGFPRSTFVNIVRLVLTHKEVPYTFKDLEPDMGRPSHLALHPFNRVPILRHAPAPRTELVGATSARGRTHD